MPVKASFEFEIAAERDLAMITLKGPVGTDEFLAGLDRMLAHPDLHPGMRVLVDMLEHVHQVDARGIDRIAKAFVLNAEAIRDSVVAVVVARAVSYGLLRMLQIKLSETPLTLSVFYDMQEAKASLGLA
jgi:hypothetical protein